MGEKKAAGNVMGWPTDDVDSKEYANDAFDKKQQATFLKQTALLLSRSGDRKRQKEFLREAYEIKLKALKEGHPEVQALKQYLNHVDWVGGKKESTRPPADGKEES